MNTYRYILLHIDTLCGTILECIQHGKDGQSVSYGGQASFSKGGCTSVRSLTRDGQAMASAQDCTRGQTWQTMAHQAKHARTSQRARNAHRGKLNTTLAISLPATPRLSPEAPAREPSGNPMLTLPVCILHTPRQVRQESRRVLIETGEL
jgi:hypothetical protein